MKKTITLNKDSNSLQRSRIYSSIYNSMWSWILLLIVFAAGCKKDEFKGEVVGLCPVVVSTDPIDKELNVALNKVISATFNTDMKASTINNTSFIITQGTTVITGTVAPTADKKVFTFTPSQPLMPFVVYKGTITTGATDTLRTAMDKNYVWTFTTIPQVTVIQTTGGSATPTFTSTQGSAVVVTAVPNTDFVFANWTEGGVVIPNAGSNYPFTMNGNRTLTANYTPVPPGSFAVNLSSLPAAGGKNTGAGAFPEGSSRTVTAAPNAGYTFVSWTENGTVVETDLDYQFILNENKTLVANYSIIPASQFSIILSRNIPAGGTVTGAGTFPANSMRSVTATPNVGYTFRDWTEAGVVRSSSTPYPFTLDANKSFVANFVINTYTLTTSTTPSGIGSVTKNPNQPTYNHGTTVQLTPAVVSGYTFTSWSGTDILAGNNDNPLVVTMNKNKTITANYTIIPVTPPLFVSTFGAFGLAGITNQGIFTVINDGNIGTTGASTTVTGFHDMTGDKYIETPLNIGNVDDGRIYTDGPPPVIFGAGGPFGGNASTKAIADAGLLAATNFYNSISPAQRPGGTVQAQELGGKTLFPGTYIAASGPFDLTNGNLTLNAQGNPNAVWVFQAPSSLTVGGVLPSSVILIGGAQSKNVFWYVGSSAVINYAGGGVMVGTIISDAGITLSSPANSTNTLVQTVLNGRAISLGASVTMVNTIINIPAP